MIFVPLQHSYHGVDLSVHLGFGLRHELMMNFDFGPGVYISSETASIAVVRNAR